ncbi:hypothetical protein P3L10_024772 [Capsicum annuum]
MAKQVELRLYNTKMKQKELFQSKERAFHILYRYLKYLGYDVVYVRNFNDMCARYCEEFLRDMDDLQCLCPTHLPRVTQHMQQIIDMISKIIMNNGCAYMIDGDVYFSVDSFPEYGRGSSAGRKLEYDNYGIERVYVYSRKKNLADFALWKAAKPGEPSVAFIEV